MGFSAKSLPIWQTVWTWQKCVLLKRHSISKKVPSRALFIFHLFKYFIISEFAKSFPKQTDLLSARAIGEKKNLFFLNLKEEITEERTCIKFFKKKRKKSFCCLLFGFGWGLFCLKTVRWTEGSIKGCKWQYQAMIWSKKSSNSHPLPNSWDRAQNQMFRCFVTT